MSVHTLLKSLGIVKGRKIIHKSGTSDKFNDSTLDVAEIGFVTDQDRVYIGSANGKPILLNDGSSATDTIDAHILNKASSSTLGHVKVGANINVDEGEVSVNDASTVQKGVVQIVDDLTTSDSTKVLSASMGKILKDAIDAIGGGGTGGGTGGIALVDIPDSSPIVRGFMTSAQFNKLDNISTGANFTTIVNVLDSTSTSAGLSAFQGKIINDKVVAHTIDKTIHVTPTDVTTWNGYGARIHALEGSTANYTATVSTSWTGTSAPFTQTIAVSGILSTDNPIVFPMYSSNNPTAIAEQIAWSSIGKITTANNSITLTCFEEKPTTALTLQLKVVR